MEATKIEQIRKRDGRVVPFNRMRIENAILKAAKAVGDGGGKEWAEALSHQVVELVEQRFIGDGLPGVEDIQDIVEEVLIKTGHTRVAKAYILYREQRTQARSTKKLLLDGMKLWMTIFSVLIGE